MARRKSQQQSYTYNPQDYQLDPRVSAYQQNPQAQQSPLGGAMADGALTFGGYALGDYLLGGSEAAAAATPEAASYSLVGAGTPEALDAGAAMYGTSTAGAEGALAAEPFLGVGLGPAAAIAAGLYTGARGLNSARRQWQEGRGQQQNAVMNMANPLVGGANSMLGHPIDNEDSGYLALAANPFTTAVGAPLALAHFAGVDVLPNFWSGKDKDQARRDAMRSQLRSAGISDNQHQVTLRNGSQFDIGKDGGAKLRNVGRNIDDKEERHYYDVDFSRGGNTDKEVAALSGLATALGRTGKQGSDLVGMLHNSATSSGDSWQNVRDIIDKAGGHGAVYGEIHRAGESGKVEKGEADAYKNALDELYGVGAYAKNRGKKK